MILREYLIIFPLLHTSTKLYFYNFREMLMNDLKVLIYKLFLEIFYGKIIKQLIFFDNFLYFLLCQNFLNIFINHCYKDTYYIMHNFIGLTNFNATNRVHL